MADKNIRVELEPLLRITWPDGSTKVFSLEDLHAFTYTLIIEGLLVLDPGDRQKILSMMELELVNDGEGHMVLRKSGLTNAIAPRI